MLKMQEEAHSSKAAESLRLRRAAVGALQLEGGGADADAAEAAGEGGNHVAVRGSLARTRSRIAGRGHDAANRRAASGSAVGARGIVHQG